MCIKLNSAAFKHSMDNKITLGLVLISQNKNPRNKTLRSRNSPVSCKFGVAGRVHAETHCKIQNWNKLWIYLRCCSSYDRLLIPFMTVKKRRQAQKHPRKPRGSQSGRVKKRDESFQVQAEKPLDTDSHRTISKRSSECWLLIGHKKCFVLLCPIGEQHLLSSFREFVHDCYWLDHNLFTSFTKPEIRHFHVVVVQWRPRNICKEAWCTCKVVVFSVFCLVKLLLFLLSRRRFILNFLLFTIHCDPSETEFSQCKSAPADSIWNVFRLIGSSFVSGERTGQLWRDYNRRVRTHEKNLRDAVRRLGTIIQSIFCAQSGASILLTVWKWSGESRYPGALPPMLENFRRAF